MQKVTEVIRAGGYRGTARILTGRLLLAVTTILVGAFLLFGALTLAAPTPIASADVTTSAFDPASQPGSVDNVTILLNKEVAPPPNGVYLVGDTIVFTITVDNRAGNGGTALVVPLTDVYSPTQLSYVSAFPAPTTAASGVITFSNVGPILDGAGTTVVVTFTALASGVTTNTAIIQGVIYNSFPSGYRDPDPAYATTDIYDADWGDAPDPTYPTLRINNGARHVITGTLFLGATIDPESDGQPNPTATGDDIAGATPDDEDGVIFNSPIVPGQVATVTVTATVSGGLLNAWLDFNRDGDWADAGEQIFTNRSLAAGPNVLTFTVPAGATLGPTFARFRLSSAGGLSYTGLAMDGEVEDYGPGHGVIITQPDLTITKDDGGISTTPGGVVAYTLIYTNTGTQSVTGVTLTDTVPANTTFTPTLSSSGWSCAPNNNAGSVCTITIGAVASGGGSGSRTFAVTVVNPLPAGITQIDNTAWIQDDGTNGPDPTPSNNHDSDSTPVTAAPDLRIVKSDGNISSTPGGIITYTLTYSNAGNQADTHVVITDVVPAYSTFNAAASSDGWSCTPDNTAGSTCSISVGTVAGGGGTGSPSPVYFAVTVVTPLPAGVTQISNTACVAGDSDRGPNCGSDDTPVDAAPDLYILKDDGGVTTKPGGIVTYTLSYGNGGLGNQDATGVIITDTIPAHTTFTSTLSTSGWSCPNNNPGTVCTFNVNDLALGATGSVNFVITVDNFVTTSLTLVNFAFISDDGTNGADLNPNDNSDGDTTPVSPPTAIQFASFTGRRVGNGIRLEWSTLSELDITGFNVYRAPSPKYHGDRVNATLIPAAGLPDSSGQYNVFDADVTSGAPVYYWLEAVGANSAQWFGPIAPRWDSRVYLPLSNR